MLLRIPVVNVLSEEFVCPDEGLFHVAIGKERWFFRRVVGLCPETPSILERIGGEKPMFFPQSVNPKDLMAVLADKWEKCF